MGRVKGSGGESEEKFLFFLFSPSPFPSFALAPTVRGPRKDYNKGYHFYSPQSSTVIKSKMAATTILRTRTKFRPPKIRLYCRLLLRLCRCCVELHYGTVSGTPWLLSLLLRDCAVAWVQTCSPKCGDTWKRSHYATAYPL